MNPWQWANTIASACVVLAGTWCIYQYNHLAPWRSSAVGRHLMGFTVAVTGLFALTLAAAPGGPWVDAVRGLRALAALVIAGFLMRRASMVARAQRQHDPDRMEGPDRTAASGAEPVPPPSEPS